ncbi:hypothetical protein [Nocardia niigatensis]
MPGIPDKLLSLLVRDLRRVPELFAQLDVTITRTDAIGPRGRRAPGSERPLIMNDRASEARRELLRTLRHAAAPVPFAPTALTDRDAALAILDRLPALAVSASGEAWARDLLAVFTRAWGAVDTPAARRFAGQCVECGSAVTAPEGVRIVDCPRCGSEHDSGQHRGWMWQEAQQHTGTAAELARMLPHFAGAGVQAATIRKWHQRGKLIGCVEEWGTVFRVGDVLALHQGRRSTHRDAA